MVLNANAGLLGTYYNLPLYHPDYQKSNGGTDMVESALTDSSPTLKSGANYNQFDWWDSTYYAFQPIDSDTDLQNGFNKGDQWFSVADYYSNDHDYYKWGTAAHWEGQFYVAENKNYNYEMGSEDDSWLFIYNKIVLDLGGLHAPTNISHDMFLTKGNHDIDIFFAERCPTQSQFYLNFFADLKPTNPVPEPATMLLLGSGLFGLAGFRKKFLRNNQS